MNWRPPMTWAVAMDKSYRRTRGGVQDEAFSGSVTRSTEDESQTEGYLRIEYVLADVDGDGIAERRCIYRLKDKILSDEECDQVPVATASPVLITHRWNGMSIWEMVNDLQELKTELTRQVLNSAYLSNNPRKKVLTDANWKPYANIDDLLDSRVGAVMRQSRPDAITEDVTAVRGRPDVPAAGIRGFHGRAAHRCVAPAAGHGRQRAAHRQIGDRSPDRLLARQDPREADRAQSSPSCCSSPSCRAS